MSCFSRLLLMVAALPVIITTKAMATVKLPAFIGNNMVLQQHTQARLWGWANKGAMVTITTSWNRQVYHAKTDATGNWWVKVQTPDAGGPYTITFNDGTTLTLSNILIGEVWFCSGQSNMEMKLKGNSSPILNASEIILNADNSQLRLFTAGTRASATPVTDVKGEWNESTSATARDFSAIAWQYGNILQKKLHVPVGIIVSSVGGTMIEAWMAKSNLSAFPEVKVPEAFADTIKQPWKQPTALFNGMIAPFLGYTIKGIVWYQGESNRHEPQLYGRMLPAMAADWRSRWQLGDIPFFYVQISPLLIHDKMRSGPLLREAQLKALPLIPNSGMASTLDVGMESNIHFMDKTKPAQRLAYLALGKTYAIKGINYLPPMLKNVIYDGAKAVLTFDNAPYLTSYNKPMQLWEIAGADKVFYPAKATISTNTVTVKSDKVPNPVAVRYAFKEFVVAELYNNDGLPCSSFRTDDWDDVR